MGAEVPDMKRHGLRRGDGTAASGARDQRRDDRRRASGGDRSLGHAPGAGVISRGVDRAIQRSPWMINEERG